MKASRKVLPPEMCMADGGLVPDLGDIPIPGSTFDVANNSSTFRTGGQMPPPASLPPVVAAAMAQKAAAQNVPRENIPAPAASPAPAPVAGPSLADILGQARQAAGSLYGQYTPERRNQLYSTMLERANSMPNAVGSTLASVGDAIARGYGRDQTNFLDKTLQSGKDTTKEGLEAFDASQKVELAATSAGIDFQKMDPSSAVSKMAQEAYGGPLAKLGYGPEQLARMPASQIESVAQVALKYGDIESQKELKEATLQLQTLVANANIANQKGQRAKDVSDTQRAAAGEILKRSGNAKMLGIPIPFTSDVSGKMEKAAKDVLAQQMVGVSSSTEHPQAAEAEKWAMENPDDPRSAEILKRLGK